MADEQRVLLLSEVARMYYEDGVTQEAIAASLHLSRPTVSRLLKEAREEGIVQITIHAPFRHAAELERELAHQFPHLRRAIVLRGTDPTVVLRAAAAYVGRIVRDGDVIGLSWGNTMEQLTTYLPNKPLARATVVQLNGGVAKANAGTNAHEVVTRFGQAFRAETYYLQVPAVVDSPVVREVLIQNRETAAVLALGRQANVAVYGIGYPDPDSVLVQAGYFTPDYLLGLRLRGAVGDICSRYFTIDGQPCDDETLSDRTIGLPLQAFSEIEHAVAVVTGSHKAAGALGALRGRFLNVLVADESTALEILRLNQQGGPISHD